MITVRDVWKQLNNSCTFVQSVGIMYYFILSSEINAYQKQIKVISITSERI